MLICFAKKIYCHKLSPLPVFGSSVHISFTPSSTMLQCLRAIRIDTRLKIRTSVPIKSLHPSQKLLVVPEADRMFSSRDGIGKEFVQAGA